MDEHFTLTAVIAWLGAMVSGGVAWLLKRHIEDYTVLSREAVRKRDLKEMWDEMKDEVDSKHQENLRSVQAVATEVHGTNKRIDEMFSKLLYRNGGR